MTRNADPSGTNNQGSQRRDPLMDSIDEHIEGDGNRVDAHGPAIAHHVFEPESLDPHQTDIVSALVRDDAECRDWAQQLSKLGELSDRALPGTDDTKDLLADITRRVKQERLQRTSQPSPVSGASPQNSPTSQNQKDKSMGIRFLCPSCEKKYEVLEKFAGRRMKCTKCAEVISVPMTSTIPAGDGPDGDEPAQAAAATAAATMAEAEDDTWSNEDTVVAGSMPKLDDEPAPRPSSDMRGPSRAATPEPKPEPKPSRREKRSSGVAAAAAVAGAGAAAATSGRKARPSGGPSGRKAKVDSGRKSRSQGSGGGGGGVTQFLRRNQKQVTGMIAITVLAIFGIIGVIALGNATTTDDAAGTANVDETPKPETRVIDGFDLDVGIPDEEFEPEVTPLRVDASFPEFGEAWEDVDYQLTATGGAKPYSWRLEGSLPKGLSLDGDRVRGACEEAGEFSFAFVVSDSAGNRTKHDVKWVCDPHFEINVSAFPQNPILGEQYTHQFEATGGKAPYQFHDAGVNLPKGMEFDEEKGLLMGKPEVLGRYSLRLRVTDARNRSDEVRFRFEIDEPARTDPVVVRRRADPSMPPGPDNPEPGQDTVSRPDGIQGPDLDPRPGPVDRGEPGEIVGWQSGGNREKMQQLQQKNREGCDLMKDSKFEQAETVFFDMLRLDGGNTLALYNLACLYSLWEKHEKALTYLEEAIKYGYTDFNHLQRDPDLENIRHMPQFRVLISDKQTLMHKAAQGNLERLQAQFPNYLCKLDEENKFIFATNQSEEVLEMLTDRIINYAKAQYRDILPSKPDYYIMVILPTTQDFARLRPAANIGGWYNPGQRMLISGSIGHTLTHEFTHALHFADLQKRIGNMQAHNIWFLEGMATLYEDSKLPQNDGESAIPVDNGRLGIVKSRAANGSHFKWREYMAWPQPKFMEGGNVSLSYAQARYMTYWIYSQGKLKEYYEAYSQTHRQGADGRAGIKAMEQVFGKPLEQLEAEWVEWMKTRNFNNRPNVTLGVKLTRNPTSTGLEIDEVMPGSAAEKAGMRKSDIIVQADGRPIDSNRALQMAMAEFEAGDVIRFMVIRQETDPDTGETRQYPKQLAVRVQAK